MNKMILPNGWKSVKSSEIFDCVSDRSHNGQLQVLSATQDRGIVLRTEMDIDIKFDEKALPTYKKVVPGNFVIHLRSFQGGLAYSDVEGIISPAYTILKAKFEICDYYYKCLFQSVDYIKRLNTAIYGIRDGKQISYDTFGMIEIPLPPLPEQHVIAKILTTADRLIAVKECLITAKQKQKQWLMQNLLTGKKRLPGFSGEWEKTRLGEIADKCTAKNRDFKYSLVLTNSAQSGIIPQTEHFDKNIAIDENIDSYFIVNNGDFVYNPRISVTAPCGPIRKNHLNETGVMSPLYTVFKLKNDMINDSYIEYYFLSSAWYHYMESIANYGARHDRMSITDDNFFAMPIPLPPLPEQQAIASVLSTADNEIELLKKDLERHKLVKKYLMQQLLTGKIRVKGAEV